MKLSRYEGCQTFRWHFTKVKIMPSIGLKSKCFVHKKMRCMTPFVKHSCDSESVFIACMVRLLTFMKCRDHQMHYLCSDIPGLPDDKPPNSPGDWESDEGSSPPPDYNSSFLYPSLQHQLVSNSRRVPFRCFLFCFCFFPPNPSVIVRPQLNLLLKIYLFASTTSLQCQQTHPLSCQCILIIFCTIVIFIWVRGPRRHLQPLLSHQKLTLVNCFNVSLKSSLPLAVKCLSYLSANDFYYYHIL